MFQFFVVVICGWIEKRYQYEEHIKRMALSWIRSQNLHILHIFTSRDMIGSGHAVERMSHVPWRIVLHCDHLTSFNDFGRHTYGQSHGHENNDQKSEVQENVDGEVED
jgi:hypothetical protein